MWQGTERWINSPSSRRCPLLHKERENHDDARKGKEPVAQHVQEARSHVTRTDLKWNQQIGKRSGQSPCQHKEDHDCAVDGDQGQVGIAIQHTAWGPLPEECFENGKALTWPSQLQSEKNRKHHCNDAHKHRSYQELLRDHLVILRKDVLRNEALFVMCVSSHDQRVADSLFSRSAASARASDSVATSLSAKNSSCDSSQALYSSSLSTTTFICMLKCAAPHTLLQRRT